MPISYRKLLGMLNERGITSYKITKKDKIIGQSTYKKIQDGEHISTKTIETLCEYLKCQPGDILEYVTEEVIIENN